MKFCPNCGTKIENLKECPNCGFKPEDITKPEEKKNKNTKPAKKVYDYYEDGRLMMRIIMIPMINEG